MTDIAVKRALVSAPPFTISLAVRDMWGITKRNLLRIIRTPQLLFMTLVQPAIIILLFRYILGGAIHVPGGDYVDFAVPGIFFEVVLVGGTTTAVALATDLRSGMIDRFRSLPMARSAFLVGRTVADLCRAMLALAFTIALGVLTGFRFHNSFGSCLVGIALLIGFGFALTWVYAAIGLAVKDPQTAQMTSILPMFVLIFASSALIPVSTMPGWLQAFSRNQPASVAVDAVRALFEGGPVYHDLWQAVVWCVGIFVVFLVISLNLYRKAIA
jgi:ABC-2 type transport system permease protein/oleandomycin transport system permease protein